jgi:YHS domain-containing protein
MGWLDKYCEKCGKKVDKNTAPQRFGKYFCSEEHAEEYAKIREEQMKQAPQQRSGGGGC